jgi:hypothetical protein
MMTWFIQNAPANHPHSQCSTRVGGKAIPHQFQPRRGGIPAGFQNMPLLNGSPIIRESVLLRRFQS